MFKNFKIQRKFFSILVLFFILSGFAIFHTISIKVNNNIENEIMKVKKNEFNIRKQNLKNYIDIAYETIETNYENSTNKEYLKTKYGARLKYVVEICESIINSKLELLKKNKITLKQAKKEAIDEISKIRYDNGIGYIWINNIERPFPRMIMHPTVPSLNNKILDSSKYNCALGKNKNLFVAMVDVCVDKGSGFVDYLWPKPTKNGLTKKQPKLSYVKFISEWNWIVGTGIYIDDAKKDAIEKTKNEIRKMRYSNGAGYFWINNTDKPFPKMIMHPITSELDGKILNDLKFNCVGKNNQNLFTSFVDICEKNQNGFVEYMWTKPTKKGLKKVQPKLSYVKLFPQYNWILGTGCYVDDIQKDILVKENIIRTKNKELLKSLFGTISFFIIILTIIVYLIIKYSILKPLDKIIGFSKLIATGDISEKIKIDREDEMGILTKAIYNISNNLRNIIVTVLSSSKMIKIKTEKMNILNSELADSAASQASSLEEISASMEEIAAQTEQNATSSKNANDIVIDARKAANTGNLYMKDLSNSMKEIEQASSHISKIIKVIDEIAFQTNLLALNAAVEAARAGIHGKGFAVVAEEVRNLAQRSAVAAKETEKLIESSISKVEKGMDMSDKTAKSLNDIVIKVDEVNNIISTIALASEEQVEGILQVNSGLSQIDNSAQKTASNAYETVGLSKELEGYAHKLNKILRKFKIEKIKEKKEEDVFDDIDIKDEMKLENVNNEIKSNDIIKLNSEEFNEF